MKKEGQKHQPKMNNNLIMINVLIHKDLFKPALININYECYSIVNKNLIIELRLSRITIPLKPIIGFIKKNIKEP